MASKFIEWKKEYSVGIFEIDEQHKKWFDITNRFYDAFVENRHLEEIQRTLDEMIAYTQTHFSTEEAYFIRYNYLETSEHTDMHKLLKAKIENFKEVLAKDPSLLTFRMMSQLKTWIENHILSEDMKYSTHFLKYIK